MFYFALKDELLLGVGVWLWRQTQKGGGNSWPVGHVSRVGVLSFGLQGPKTRNFQTEPGFLDLEKLEDLAMQCLSPHKETTGRS